MNILHKLPRIDRRRFLQLIALSTISLATEEVIFPEIATADSQNLAEEPLEKYHVFVPYEVAKKGGNQTINLRSGETCKFKISPRIVDNSKITIKEVGLNKNNIIVILHTLYDSQMRIADKIYHEIDHADFICGAKTKEKAKYIYELMEEGEYTDDIATLNLLQYLIASSNLDENIRLRHEIACQNSHLVIIEKALESALNKSPLSEQEKKLLRGTYQYVRASEPVPNFEHLKNLDAYIENSDIPIAIKRTYSLASAKSRALTVDFIIVNLIESSSEIDSITKAQYRSTYQEVRDGKEVSNIQVLDSLNSFILNSNILESSKVVYLLAQNRFFDKNAESTKENFGVVTKVARFVGNQASSIVPTTTNVLSSLGVEAGTGIALSSLQGSAATSATLAALGGGSVATGGLGMLGGLAVVTGGAALIGAAGLLSIALVSNLNGEDLKNLGIAGVTGTLFSAASVIVAWTGASALGVAGTLSGAAAITTTISALGGLSVITGGAALIAFGTGFVVWSFLKGQKHRDKAVLNQLESRLYTLTETPLSGSLKELLGFLKSKLPNKYELEQVFVAPDIPLDKLSNALKKFGVVDLDEQILALIDTSLWNDAKQGILLTNTRVLWKGTWAEPDFINYSDLASDRKDLPKLYNQEENSSFYSLLKEIGERYYHATSA